MYMCMCSADSNNKTVKLFVTMLNLENSLISKYVVRVDLMGDLVTDVHQPPGMTHGNGKYFSSTQVQCGGRERPCCW